LASPGDTFSPSFLNIYHVDLEILRALGVRFLISDATLESQGLMLRAIHQAAPSDPPAQPEVLGFLRAGARALEGEVVAARLYEISDPNLGSYSPVRPNRAKTAIEVIRLLRSPGFSMRHDMVTQESIASNLVRARDGRIQVDAGRLHVTATSAGTSVILLPLQFSHCLSIRSSQRAGTPGLPRVLRANLVQAAILFDRILDAEISFIFGLGSKSECRKRDIVDYEALDFRPWGR